MQHADNVYVNGKIYTQAEDKIATVMAVSGEQILYVGTGNQAIWEPYVNESTNIIDLKGKTVLPGFIDAHTHPICIALTDWRVSLPRTNDVNELLEYVKDYCEKHPKEELPYFLGENFYLTMFDEKGPRKELLDKYVSDRPVRIQDDTAHSCWYNSKAFELMGIKKGEPDPECIKGTLVEVIRDEDGEPTGWVLEQVNDAMDKILYGNLGWHPDEYATEKSLMPFLNFLNECGVMALMDGFTENEESIKLFYEMDKKGILQLYYEGMVKLPFYEKLEETIATVHEWQKKYTSNHVRLHTIKFFLDGTNELGDCASLEPLRTDPSGKNYGNINMSQEQLTNVMVRLNEEKLDLHLHIVGDRAFRIACDAMEEAKKICGESWCIDVTSAHCELVHPDDQIRPTELGMIINWSPHWAGGYFGDKAKDYLGEERFNTMYDFTKMIETGAIVTFSSDVFSYKEANRANPFFGIQCSATRIDPEFPLDEKVHPRSMREPESAKLSVKDLIYGYTKQAARQLRLEDKIGSLESGKLANYMILEKDPYETEPEKLLEIKPEQVFFEGKEIYKK